MTLITAAEEYKKDERLKPADLAQLRDWLRKEPHLPQCITDEMMLAMLHSCDYSLEKAKQLVENNITARSNMDFFNHRDPLAMDNQKSWNFVDFWLGPKVTKDNYRIFYGGLGNYNTDLFDFLLLLKMFVNVIDVAIATRGLCPGYVVILNCHGVTITHLAKANISLIRDALNYVQDAVCLKMKEIHVIKCSPIIDKILFAVKPFLRKSLLDILYLHSGDMEDFYKAVPKELIPSEIGGTVGSQKDLIDSARHKVEEMRDWLVDQEKLKVDEKKRVNAKKDTMAGSFRKLDLD